MTNPIMVAIESNITPTPQCWHVQPTEMPFIICIVYSWYENVWLGVEWGHSSIENGLPIHSNISGPSLRHSKLRPAWMESGLWHKLATCSLVNSVEWIVINTLHQRVFVPPPPLLQFNPPHSLSVLPTLLPSSPSSNFSDSYYLSPPPPSYSLSPPPHSYSLSPPPPPYSLSPPPPPYSLSPTISFRHSVQPWKHLPPLAALTSAR